MNKLSKSVLLILFIHLLLANKDIDEGADNRSEASDLSQNSLAEDDIFFEMLDFFDKPDVQAGDIKQNFQERISAFSSYQLQSADQEVISEIVNFNLVENISEDLKA